MLNEKVEEAIYKALDVEKNEVFGLRSIKDNHEYVNVYRINENGLQVSTENKTEWLQSSSLNTLLTGYSGIIKKPFIPKLGQGYYVVNILSPSLFFRCINDGDLSDKQAIKHKLAFKTKQGAINKAKEILKLIKGSEG